MSKVWLKTKFDNGLNMKIEFMEWCKGNGWLCEQGNREDLPDSLLQRYSSISETWYSFISDLKILSNAEDNTWFLCPEDYKEKGSDSWRYNEFEIIGLDAADGDKEEIKKVKSFWDVHLPVVMSVKYGYEFFAINISTGEVVYGTEPEFEDVSIVAADFYDFLTQIIRGDIEL